MKGSRNLKAVYVNSLGLKNEIIIGDLARPKRNENHILLKTIATTINLVDVYIRTGKYPIDSPMPFLLGRDVVGEVIEASPESEFNVGDIVWSNSMGYENRQGVSAEYLSINENRLYRLPDKVDPFQAVASLHSTTTAVLLLTDLVKTKKNESILIQGGGGNVGRKLVELSKLLGLKVTTTSASKDFNYLTKLGAKCLDYNDHDNEERYDYIIDTSGKNKLSTNVTLLNENGKILMITNPADSNFDPWDFYTNGKQILGFVLSKVTIGQLNQAAILINDQFKNGKFLDNNIIKKHFFYIKDFHRLFENEKYSGKKPVFYYSDN